MAIPGQGWLPNPINGDIIQFILPEEFPVYYYICTPGPYDPLQPYEKPIIEAIEINQVPFADSGYKNGGWGWVAGIHWVFAYGDALIDNIWPPLPPVPVDDKCPGGSSVDESCPPALVFSLESDSKTVFTQEAAPVLVVIKKETRNNNSFSEDSSVVIVVKADDKPA